jgi:transcriptional/translational regulatory protein YebC/TACO1
LNSQLSIILFSKNPIYNIIFQNNDNLHHHRHYYETHVEDDYDDYLNFMNNNINSIIHVDQILQTLHNFKSLFYALKYKKNLRYFLWEKIRRPKIEAKYHPSNLQKMVDGLNEEDDLMELLEKW